MLSESTSIGIGCSSTWVRVIGEDELLYVVSAPRGPSVARAAVVRKVCCHPLAPPGPLPCSALVSLRYSCYSLLRPQPKASEGGQAHQFIHSGRPRV